MSGGVLHRLTANIHKMLPQVVFVLGGPGAGKGTQCQNIVKEYGFVHLSAGDLLRAERQNPASAYGEMIEGKIRNGEIVPVEITCSLLDQAMQKSGKDKFLIDGFPRNKDNLEGWERAMSDKSEILFVMFFDCSLDVCTERCLGRGAAGSGRSDDNLESLKKRFQTYSNDTMPIINHFEKLDLVRRIDASQTPEKVFQKVQEILNAASIKKVTGSYKY